MSKFWFLVGFALKKRVKTKSFLISNIIIAIFVILLANMATIIQAIGGSFSDADKIIVFNETEYTNAYDYFIENVDTSSYEVSLGENYNTEKKQEYLENCTYYIVLENEGEQINATIVGDDISLTDQLKLTSYITYTKQKIYIDNVDSSIVEELEKFQTPPTITYVAATDGSSNSTERQVLGIVSIFLMVPIFIMLVMLMQFIGVDIIEEKSTRAIEIIITNVTPVQHFSSKILSSIFFILIQAAIVFVAGLVGFGIFISTNPSITSITSTGASSTEAIASMLSGINMSGSFTSVISNIPLMLLMAFLFILAGFTFYLVAMAVLAAMSTNNEDFQQFQSPLMIVILAGFYIFLFGIQFEGSIFIKICGYIPLFSPLIAPGLFITGEFGVLQALISLAILIVFDVIIVYFGIPIYKASLLNFSDEKFFKRIVKIIKMSRYK